MSSGTIEVESMTVTTCRTKFLHLQHAIDLVSVLGTVLSEYDPLCNFVFFSLLVQT
jgi:hypothetical protein